jgi:hypothetical protein
LSTKRLERVRSVFVGVSSTTIKVLYNKIPSQRDRTQAREAVENVNQAASHQDGDGDSEFLKAPVVCARVKTGISNKRQNCDKNQGKNRDSLQGVELG